jgi:hypothetical protein
MQSKATTVEQYLKELPPDRREAIAAVREVILRNLDGSYEEGMQYGMIGYFVPHRIYSAGYHCDPKQPVPYVALASQKNHMAVYLMCVYGDQKEEKRFRDDWAKTGKKLDMGKSCIRFRKLDDMALNVLGDAIRRTPASVYLRLYESAFASKSADKRKAEKKGPASGKTNPTSSAPKKIEVKKAAKSPPKKTTSKAGKKVRPK